MMDHLPGPDEPLPDWAQEKLPYAARALEIGRVYRQGLGITGHATPAHLSSIAGSLRGLTIHRKDVDLHGSQEGPDCTNITMPLTFDSEDAEVRAWAWAISLHLGRNVPGVWIKVGPHNAHLPLAELTEDVKRQSEIAVLTMGTLTSAFLAGLNDMDGTGAAELVGIDLPPGNA